jgi:hypothetical protein
MRNRLKRDNIGLLDRMGTVTQARPRLMCISYPETGYESIAWPNSSSLSIEMIESYFLILSNTNVASPEPFPAVLRNSPPRTLMRFSPSQPSASCRTSPVAYLHPVPEGGLASYGPEHRGLGTSPRIVHPANPAVNDQNPGCSTFSFSSYLLRASRALASILPSSSGSLLGRAFEHQLPS